MAEALPLAYDLTYFDEAGQEFEGTKIFHSLSHDTARELQFEESALAAGAASYSVRLLRPNEVKAIVKAERKARGEDFGSQVFVQLGKLAGLDHIPNMLTYMEQGSKLTGTTK